MAVEFLLNLEIQDVGSYGILCSPNDLRTLAVGFAFSEGMINIRDDILMLNQCENDPSLVRLRIAHPNHVQGGKRNLLVVSSCGMCGSQFHMDEYIKRLPKVSGDLRVPVRFMSELPSRMFEMQRLFAATGGVHAAAIFHPHGELLAFGEDVGRHNALDKALGNCVLSDRSANGCILVLSGRVSFELLAKAARAGIELIAAVSAPSSLAVEVAAACNITLCGFVREGRFTVYSHAWRFEDFVERGLVNRAEVVQ